MESRSVTIHDKKLDYKLHRRAGNRHLRLAVKGTGDVVVSAPKYFPLYLINKFITSRWEWLSKNLQKSKDRQDLFSKKFSTAEINLFKKNTVKLVKERLIFFNKFYGFQFNRIAIRNQSTRWGSCSRQKNLNFNCRLCLLPPELADYIIVHELCHIKEMNHGPKFWSLVAQTEPDYRLKRRQLRSL